MIDLLSFGEMLWDVIEDVPHLGGAPLNLAAHAKICGLNTAIVSAVGNDDLGRAALQRADDIGIETSWIVSDSVHPTGTVSVKLTNTLPEYIIHEGVAWDNITVSTLNLEQIVAAAPRAICFGTLAQRSATSRNTLNQLLDALPSALVFYDVNLRQNFWTPEIITSSLRKTTWLKLNDDEAELLNRVLFLSEKGFGDFADNLFDRFPVQVILITCGPHGCIVFERDAQSAIVPGVRVDATDTVGAGDAFSAAFLAALLKGKNARAAAEEGNERGALVATKPGAIPEALVQSC